jgi:hypothetical protein
MRVARRLLLILGVTVAMLLTVLPAQADTVTRRDRANDAAERVDVTRARYTHRPARISALARIPNLGRAGDASLSITRFEVFEAGYVLRITKRAGQRPRVRLFSFDHFSLNRRRCKGISGTWRARSIRLGVPTRCLRGHARPKVFTQFGISRGRQLDRAPAVRRLSRG